MYLETTDTIIIHSVLIGFILLVWWLHGTGRLAKFHCKRWR